MKDKKKKWIIIILSILFILVILTYFKIIGYQETTTTSKGGELTLSVTKLGFIAIVKTKFTNHSDGGFYNYFHEENSCYIHEESLQLSIDKKKDMSYKLVQLPIAYAICGGTEILKENESREKTNIYWKKNWSSEPHTFRAQFESSRVEIEKGGYQEEEKYLITTKIKF